MRVARVAVDKAAPSFDRLFSYSVPDALRGEIAAGRRVLVPFGAGNRKRQGMVFSVADEEPQAPLKPLEHALDDGPLLDGELLRLCAHLRNTVFCTYYEAVRLMIPSGLDTRVTYTYRLVPDAAERFENLSDAALRAALFLRDKCAGKSAAEDKLLAQLGLSGDGPLRELVESGAAERFEDLRRRVLDEKITMVRLLEQAGPRPALTPKQRAVVRLLEETQDASLREVCYYAAVTRSVVDGLARKGAVAYYEREVYRAPIAPREADGTETTLSPEQQRAFDSLLGAQQGGGYAVSLLYGVTGSGKTQVFLKLAREVVAGGRGVLVLVPEIALTPQTIDQFYRRFAGRVAVMHSGLSLGERLDEYKRVARGEAVVVVGTRSAVFAPVRDLGLIIIDEEQENSYKSEKSPRFHARDVAKWRAHYHATQLVLASATPSVESYYFARRGVYRLVTIAGRYTGSVLPDVYILDSNDNPPAEPSTVLSQRLCDELWQNLRAGEQSVLLLNRRGYHTLVKCSACGEVAKCPNCSVSLTFHSANGALVCHYCGYMRPKDDPCPLCGGRYERHQGAGTQRVEEELRALYPEARVLRMDMDTTMQKLAHEERFGQFARHEYDIMVGTQMVAKGLNFPDVTLVGVLCTDQSLYGDDFRSFERTFSLITQAVGRAGRGQKRGRAFIQTYSPDNPVIELAASQQYDRFFAGEIRSRKLGLYPPYCAICAICASGETETAVHGASEELLRCVERVARADYPDLPLRVLGPSDFALYKMAGKYRRKLLLKCRNDKRLRGMIRGALALYEENRTFKKVSVFVDMYYDSY